MLGIDYRSKPLKRYNFKFQDFLAQCYVPLIEVIEYTLNRFELNTARQKVLQMNERIYLNYKTNQCLNSFVIKWTGNSNSTRSVHFITLALVD